MLLAGKPALRADKHALFRFDLLEAQAVRQLVEVVGKGRPLPVLVLLGVCLLQALQVLRHLLEHLLLELALRLAGVERAIGGFDRRPPVLDGRVVELQLLRRAGRRLVVGAGIGGFGEHTLHGRFLYDGRHLDRQWQGQMQAKRWEGVGGGK